MDVLRLGFSPCPNDTFIFGGLVGGARHALPLPLPFDLDYVICDVEELNRMALRKALDITKISVGSYPSVADSYVILTSGGALTRTDGPVVVSRRLMSLEEFRSAYVAIPGKGTTAARLLDILNLHDGHRIEMLFSDIMPAVLKGDVDAGVVIHEGRWTYKSYGLVKLLDLGILWEKAFSVPLPLGVIIIRRDLVNNGYARVINEAIYQSIRYSRNHREEVDAFIKQHATEMSRDIIDRHIEAFVNEFSEDLGDVGKRAIRQFIKKINHEGSALPERIFWDEITLQRPTALNSKLTR